MSPKEEFKVQADPKDVPEVHTTANPKEEINRCARAWKQEALDPPKRKEERLQQNMSHCPQVCRKTLKRKKE